jgi:hypothetical protein
MAREFVLTSAEDGATLRLSCSDDGLMSATVAASGPGYEVRVPIYLDLSPSLPDLFKELEEPPTLGRKDLSWETLEGDFKLQASSDPQGHIYITYHLRSPDIGSNRWWSFTGRLVLELGSLPTTRKRLERFWRASA